MTNKTLKLKNGHLLPLSNWLAKLALPGRQSRERTRFIELLKPRLEEIEEIRNKIVETYAKKDENSRPIVKDNLVEYPRPEDREIALREFSDFMESIYEINCQNIEETIKTIREILQTTDEIFSGNMANIYNDWITAFEKLDL